MSEKYDKIEEPAEDPADDKRYAGLLTITAHQHGQGVHLDYGTRKPTNRDVRRMIVLLRRTADQLTDGF